MKLFTTSQISEIDNYTIEHEPILSVNLMERAVRKLLEWFKSKYDHSRRVIIFAGPGKNGGDGLALARLLVLDGYSVSVFLVRHSGSIAAETTINLERLVVNPRATVEIVSDENPSFPPIDSDDVVVDAIFGTGLSRPCSGGVLELIRHINGSHAEVVSIDVPSGFHGEKNCGVDKEGVVKAHWTVTFQFPRISFMLADLAECLGKWTVLDIGLHNKAIANTGSPYSIVELTDAAALLKQRSAFCHKGCFGHVLLCAGSYGMMGAAVLSARGCSRSGVGLLTTHIPACGYQIMQSSVPEAIVSADTSEKTLTSVADLTKYSVVGVGPGIGMSHDAQEFVKQLLQSAGSTPMVIDADALNILSLNPQWWQYVPKGSVITPHPGEFDRLTKPHGDAWSRMESAIEFAKSHDVVVVLKGHHTLIASPDGTAVFNSTGNAGLATGGTGDVLTGMVAGFLAQGYNATNAAILAVYIHGLAADLALLSQSEESLTASDIIDNIGVAFKEIRRSNGDI